ncbi:pyrimidine/purine nucleoside phosphorylase [Pedobacter sp. KLB.chiD]|uniref:pyrimidine/purine nucleoside phosphorylase n=1 Tax=Pedobacter sp. KLB.chiD TaxID=3387402 RepID=UPI00399BAA7A
MITENQYFDGKVKSLGYETAEGKSTVGVINPGEYAFGTAQKETMHVIEGELEVLLPDATELISITAGNFFEVPAHASFKLKAVVQTAYLCQYR